MIINRTWLLLVVGATLNNMTGAPLTLINNTRHDVQIIARGSKKKLSPSHTSVEDITDDHSLLCVVNSLIIRIEHSGPTVPTAEPTCELQTLLMMAGQFETPLDSITVVNDTWYPAYCKDLNSDSTVFGESMVVEPGQEMTKNAQHRSPERMPKKVTPVYGIIGLTQDGTYHTFKYPRRRYFSNGAMTCVWLNQQISLSTFFLFNDPASGWRYSVIKRSPKDT